MRLPKPLESVPAPDFFSPSALANVGECLLKLIAPSDRSIRDAQLVTGPNAETGRVYHRLLELAFRGAITIEGSPEESARRELDRLFAEATDQLTADEETRRYAKLRATMFVRERIEKEGWMVQRAAAMLSQSRRPHASAASATARQPSTGAEVGLESKKLRLRGKADVIKRTGPDSFQIRDLKTGHSFGESAPRQLRLYTLMLRDKHPNARISAVVDTAEEIEVDTSENALEETRVWLASVTDRLPAGEPIDASAVSVFGRDCVWCRHRPLCGTYRSTAPRAWMVEHSDGPLPADVWGQITAIDTANGRMNASLLDASGRAVRVAALDEGRGDCRPLKAGDQAYFFELEPAGKLRAPSGRFVHPRNFRELPTAPNERRAWALRVYSSDDPSLA